MHGTLDHRGCLPTAVVITDGKTNEVRVARAATFAPGTIVVMDRGYLDFAWFARLQAQGVFFVTRMKETAAYAVLEARPVPTRGGIVVDERICLTGPCRRPSTTPTSR